MAKTGRSYSGQRSPSHMTSEASRLREMVEERDKRIATLEEVVEQVRQTCLDHNADAPESGEILGIIQRRLGDRP